MGDPIHKTGGEVGGYIHYFDQNELYFMNKGMNNLIPELRDLFDIKSQVTEETGLPFFQKTKKINRLTEAIAYKIFSLILMLSSLHQKGMNKVITTKGFKL